MGKSALVKGHRRIGGTSLRRKHRRRTGPAVIACRVGRRNFPPVLAAILAADVVGYSRLMGDKRMTDHMMAFLTSFATGSRHDRRQRLRGASLAGTRQPLLRAGLPEGACRVASQLGSHGLSAVEPTRGLSCVADPPRGAGSSRLDLRCVQRRPRPTARVTQRQRDALFGGRCESANRPKALSDASSSPLSDRA